MPKGVNIICKLCNTVGMLQAVMEYQQGTLQKQALVKRKAYLVTSPGGLAKAWLGTVNPHDAYLQRLSHPCTPLHHQAHSHRAY